MKARRDILFEQFTKFIRKKKLINKDDKILLAVSGGIDSTVMTHLFYKAGFDFGITHCNFRLRGKESDRDATFVERLAEKYNKSFFLKEFDTKKFAEANDYSIQEAARELRYKWFNEICTDFSFTKTATAHNLDDSIETFFINISRGTGTAGLRGIPLVNQNIIRPLLFASREEIEAYTENNTILFREDASNRSDKYLRNRIRHHLIPFLKKKDEDFLNHMQELMDDFAFIDNYIKDKINRWKKKNLKIDKADNTLIPIEKILHESQPASFLSLVLYTLNIKGIDCEKVLFATPGKKFHHKDVTVLVDRKYLLVSQRDPEIAPSFNIKKLPAKVTPKGIVITVIKSRHLKTKAVTKDNKIQRIDAGKISMPLTLRTWKPGDYFFPLGMKGKKKISDFYTDQKIDRFKKDNIYLLLSGNDIVCILGHRIDDRYKITPDTKVILTIEQKENEPGATTL